MPSKYMSMPSLAFSMEHPKIIRITTISAGNKKVGYTMNYSTLIPLNKLRKIITQEMMQQIITLSLTNDLLDSS